MSLRVGIGYDSHRFAPGGPMILGGVRVPSEFSLVGHSDADAVAHAVTDAVLGACAAGDIGALFPDTDAANKGKDSIAMLAAAVQHIDAMGYEVCNIDITVIAEQPKIGPYRSAMIDILSHTLRVKPDAVSIKGKTNEGMGWIGRNEGLACIAVATVSQSTAALDA